MNWINLQTNIIRTPEYSGCEPVQRATWLNALSYCAEQENGGIISDCRQWSDRRWQQSCGVTLAEVDAAAPLLQWQGNDLVVWNYPSAKEEEVQAKRAAGRKGGRKSTVRSLPDVALPVAPDAPATPPSKPAQSESRILPGTASPTASSTLPSTASPTASSTLPCTTSPTASSSPPSSAATEGEGEGKENGIGIGIGMEWNHHLPAPAPPSSSASPPERESKTAGFELFWKAYPKKKARPAAAKAWSAHGCGRMLDVILAKLAIATKSDDWLRDGGQYIPYPQKWLSQKRWEDELTDPAASSVPKRPAGSRPVPYEAAIQI